MHGTWDGCWFCGLRRRREPTLTNDDRSITKRSSIKRASSAPMSSAPIPALDDDFDSPKRTVSFLREEEPRQAPFSPRQRTVSFDDDRPRRAPVSLDRPALALEDAQGRLEKLM
jgi:hypothetical protein